MEGMETGPLAAGHEPPLGDDAYADLLARVERESTPQKVQLLRYWLSLRDGGLPDYRRFDPLDIANLLGDLAVVDVVERGLVAGQGRDVGNPVTHRARADHGYRVDRVHAPSHSVAIPCPTPMHIEASPRRAPRRFIS